MKVQDVMQTRLSTVCPEDHLGLALQQMLWQEVRHLPVMNGSRFVGLLSERDILKAQAELELPMTTIVADVMQTAVEHTHPFADLAAAAATLSTKGLGCLPVLKDDQLVGILTPTDVLGYVAQQPLPQPSKGQCAADLMTRNPLAVHEDDSLLNAAAKMASKGVRHLCVVDVEGRILGMLSDRDLRSQVGQAVNAQGSTAAPGVAERRVQQAMTREARYVLPSTPVADLVNIFLVERLGAVPVVDTDDRVVGIVSYIDVLRALAAGALS